MRLANVGGRLTVVTSVDGAGVPLDGLDVQRASEGRFSASVPEAYMRWAELRQWAAQALAADPVPDAVVRINRELLGPPSTEPAQVFAIGLNYQAHAAETGISEQVGTPPTFTKFRTCLTGAFASVELPSDSVDWEVELVAVIGTRARNVSPAEAWSHVAGMTIGQDLSEREVQMTPPMPQFSLGKSFPGFGPMGPALVTVDELDDPDDLALSCEIEGDRVLQSGRTNQMISGVPELVARLSSITTLLPGDVIFTGTPSGVGMALDPPTYLRPGQTLITRIEKLGEMRTSLVAPAGA